MSDHIPTVDEILYYADFWLSLVPKQHCMHGDEQADALVAIKMAHDRYRAALEKYTQVVNTEINVGQLAARLQAEVDAMMEDK